MCSSFTVNAVEIQQRCVNTALKQTVHVFTSQCLGIKHSLMTTLVARWKKQTSFRSTVTCTLLVTQTNLQSTSFRCLTETWTESSISTTTSAYWVLSLGDRSKKNTNVRKRVPPSLLLDFIDRCLMTVLPLGIFHMYDIDKDGFITSSEMLRIFKAIDKLTSVGKVSQVQESPEMVLAISSYVLQKGELTFLF